MLQHSSRPSTWAWSEFNECCYCYCCLLFYHYWFILRALIFLLDVPFLISFRPLFQYHFIKGSFLDHCIENRLYAHLQHTLSLHLSLFFLIAFIITRYICLSFVFSHKNVGSLKARTLLLWSLVHP